MTVVTVLVLADHGNNRETEKKEGDLINPLSVNTVTNDKDNRAEYEEEKESELVTHHLESLTLRHEKDVPTVQRLQAEVTKH